jgi:acyl-CoA reductase-like NAD-dependent aldehyde dehydrogenase
MTAGTADPSVAQQADAIAARLTTGAATWAATPAARRAEMLAEFGALVNEQAETWVAAAAAIKQLPEGSELVGEEWISGPWAVLTYVNALRQTLAKLGAGQSPVEGFHVRSVPGDRVAVRVLPHNLYDHLLLSGFTAEVWMPPGVTEDTVRQTAGLGARHPERNRGTVLVLGAGNIFSIAPLDTLYQLYAENRAVVLKLNPLTDPLAPVFQAVFAPFVEIGAVEIITGGVEIGGALAQHPAIGAVHMTGSEATHDAIVWGVGAEGERARQAGEPALKKPITSELGGVAPVIVVPGRWSTSDLRFQARHVATQRLHNAGSNCIAAQVVVLSSDWDQKDAFLAELREAFATAPARPAWYPGAHDRVDAACASHEGRSETIDATTGRTLLTGLDLGEDEHAFETEYFAPVLAVAELPGTGADFLSAAVDAANTRLRGTLGANIVIHPQTLHELGDAFEQHLADLHYGTIGVNAWTGVGYLTAAATWGAFPGHTLDDVQSGIGVVHNALLLDEPERTVVRGPFRPLPRSLVNGELAISPVPPWFVHNRTSATTGRRLTRLAANPRLTALPAIFASALRG